MSIFSLRPRIALTASMLIASTAAMALVACGGGASSPATGTPTPAPALSVVTTIYPVTFFAERVGGTRVEVRSLMRPGVEAHDFEPAPGDIRDIGAADVLVYVAPSFERWVADAISSVGGDIVVVETADLPEGEEDEHADDEGDEHSEDDPGHDHEGADPHVWLNPIEATQQIRAIQAGLTEADAEGAALYQQNADALVAELTELDREFSEALSSCALSHMVVSHEAYGHLAGRYGIEQIALAGLSAEFESTPQRIADVIREMERLGIEHILQEPILSDELAKTVAGETGAVLLPLHPLESLTRDQIDAGDTYFTVMRRNLESLRTALQCP